MIMAECSEEKERNHAVRTSCHAMLGHVQRSTEPDVKLFYDDSPERTCTFATGYMCASELEDRIDNVMLLQTKVDAQLGKRTCSDRRLKTNIVKIGMSPSHLPVYMYQYKEGVKGFDPTQKFYGTMAQDLLEMGRGDAVSTRNDGFYQVDYSKID